MRLGFDRGAPLVSLRNNQAHLAYGSKLARSAPQHSAPSVFIPPDSGDGSRRYKEHPPMKRLFLSTSLALALSSSLVFAQEPAAPTPATKHHHAHNPQRETARLTKKLNLSADQSAKLEPILADRDQKIAALTSDSTISPMIMKKQMHAIRHQTREQLATVLTPDQLQQMKALRHSHGDPAQAQPRTNPPAGL
jgi:periplasmic protein CpxP/Spy